jgi:tetratricopeptide (TPR) repeat protein
VNRLNENRRSTWIGALLASVTLAAFWPVVHNDFIKLDDRKYVTENPHVLSGLTWPNVQWAFQPGYASNWHPLTWLSHMLDVQFFGLNPGWHHLVNLVLHIANTLLLFVVLKRMADTVWRSASVAALFAVHPLHVESVAWVAERKDVLSTLFFLLTLWAYVRYTGFGNPDTGSGRAKWSWYALAVSLFALGLMSKPMLMTVPGVLLLLDFWPLRRIGPGTRWRLLWEKIPFLCLSTLSGIVTLLTQARGHNLSVGLPLESRVANAIASYVKYLGKTIWPAHLAIFYPHPDLRYPLSYQWADSTLAVAALVLAAISVSAILRRQRQPWFAMGWFWYLGTLVPVIGIVQVGSQAMADRYTYIPLIGIFVCFVWGANELLGGARSGKTALVAVGIFVTAACVAVTRMQLKYWRNDLALFEHTLAVTQNNALAHYLIGLDLQEEGKLEPAMAHFRAAVEYDPDYADAHSGLGDTLYAMGRTDEAMEQYQAAIRLQPWNAQAHTGLGSILWMRGQQDEALAQFTEAVRFRPDSAQAQYNMGAALSGLGRFSEAAAHLSEAVRLDPDFREARALLSDVVVKRANQSPPARQ